MQIQGHSLHDIAQELDYNSEAAVAVAIRRELDRQAAQIPATERTALIKLEDDRLNYMLTKVWQQVEFGDAKAIETALKIIGMRIKLHQMDAIDTSSSTTQVLVISGAENEYIEKLKRLSE